MVGDTALSIAELASQWTSGFLQVGDNFWLATGVLRSESSGSGNSSELLLSQNGALSPGPEVN